jgi:hypothetical protein
VEAEAKVRPHARLNLLGLHVQLTAPDSFCLSRFIIRRVIGDGDAISGPRMRFAAQATP